MFQWLLHKKELMTTFDGKCYYDLLGKLDAAGVSYRTRQRSAASRGRQRGILGSVGENPAYSIQYYIYVLDRDLEKARYALR